MSFRALRVDARLMPGEQNSSAEVLRAQSAKFSTLISTSFFFPLFFFIPLFHCSLYINITSAGEQRGSKSGGTRAGQVANAYWRRGLRVCVGGVLLVGVID